MTDLYFDKEKSCRCGTQSVRRSVEDLSGSRYGMLVVIAPTAERRNRNILWKCRCDCGNIVLCTRKELLTRRNPNCGCIKVRKGTKPQDLTGNRYGRLTVLNITDKRTSNGSVIWHCRCDCGNCIDVQAPLLSSGNVQSCGCMKAESMAEARSSLHYVDGTCLEWFGKRSSGNPLGKGISRRGNGRYLAKITMQGTQYYLGTFTNLADAVKARQRAEDVLFGGFSREYQEWQRGDQKEPFHFDTTEAVAALETLKSS